MAAHYNFRKLLDIDPDDESFICVGIDESQIPVRRCQMQILVEDRKAASRILDEMNVSSDCDKTLKHLPELVFRTLCAGTHRSKPECCQVGQVYTEWREIIRDHWTLVKRESSRRAFDRWRLRKVKGSLEPMRMMVEDESENEGISPKNSVDFTDPFLHCVQKISQKNQDSIILTSEKPSLANNRNTFGNYSHFTPIFGSTRSSHSQNSRLSALIAALPLPPRRKTWPEDDPQITGEPQTTGLQPAIETRLAKSETHVGATALLDPTPPPSPVIEVHITEVEPPINSSQLPCTPRIPLKSPLRAPCLERLSFVSSMSCTSIDALPSTGLITPPMLDYHSPHSQGTGDTTTSLPSPTPRSPRAVPWFLREEFSIPAPQLYSEFPSRTGSGFRTSAIIEVDVDVDADLGMGVCGVCRLARGEEGCTCCWADLMFSSESDTESSTSGASGRSGVRVRCLRVFGRRFLGGVRRIRRRVFGVVRQRRGSGEWSAEEKSRSR